MNKWKPVSDYVLFSTKGITPTYVKDSSIIVLNQKCIRNGCIDYSLSQFTDDSKQISKTKFIQKGDILINSTGIGTAGRVAFVDKLPDNKRLITDSHILLLRCHSYFEAQCLSYLLYSFENKLMSFMTGSSGQSELDKVVLMNLLLKLIENPSQQQKIAKVLSDIDAKIELNNKINAELEAMAKTLYDYWFVQFDFPDANGKPYKSSGGKMVWNEALKREIPEGWEVKELGKLIKPLESGKRPKGGIDKDLKNGIPSLGAESIDNLGYFNYKSTKYIPFSYKEKITSGIIQNNDILIYKDGAYVGKTTLFRDNFPFEFATINEHVFLLRSSKIYFQEYLFFTLKLESYYNLMQSLGQKAAQPGLNQNDLKSLNIIEPNHEIVIKYQQLIEPFFGRIFNNSKENQHLASLRDWLLPMLMNGQVTVGEVERELGMVAEPKGDYKK